MLRMFFLVLLEINLRSCGKVTLVGLRSSRVDVAVIVRVVMCGCALMSLCEMVQQVYIPRAVFLDLMGIIWSAIYSPHLCVPVLPSKLHVYDACGIIDETVNLLLFSLMVFTVFVVQGMDMGDVTTTIVIKGEKLGTDEEFFLDGQVGSVGW